MYIVPFLSLVDLQDAAHAHMDGTRFFILDFLCRFPFLFSLDTTTSTLDYVFLKKLLRQLMGDLYYQQCKRRGDLEHGTFFFTI